MPVRTCSVRFAVPMRLPARVRPEHAVFRAELDAHDRRLAASTRRSASFDHHRKARRASAPTTRTPRGQQSQPATNTIENSQVRLSDGSIVFTPDLFGPGITVDKVNYDMTSVDAGVKYKGLALEGGVSVAAGRASRHRGSPTSTATVQVQSSAMVVPRASRRTSAARQSGARYGNASEVRARPELVLRQGTRAPRQRGVAPSEQVPRGVHGRSLPRGGQRKRLPYKHRDELLSAEHAPRDAHVPTFHRSGFGHPAEDGRRLCGAHARRTGPPRRANDDFSARLPCLKIRLNPHFHRQRSCSAAILRRAVSR